MLLLAKLLLLCSGPVLLVVGAIFVVNTVLGVDDLAQCTDGPQPAHGQCRPADAIVAISGGDTAARTHEAVKLYQVGWAGKLILSGAAEDMSGPSNAEVMRRMALEEGVPDSAILVDRFALNTSGNALETNAIVKLHGLKRIILVTSPYHQRRAGLEFQKALGQEVTVLNHPASQDRGWPQANWWLNPTSWWLAGSELVKLAFITVAGL